jgi:hypothetical protein
VAEVVRRPGIELHHAGPVEFSMDRSTTVVSSETETGDAASTSALPPTARPVANRRATTIRAETDGPAVVPARPLPPASSHPTATTEAEEPVAVPTTPVAAASRRAAATAKPEEPQAPASSRTTKARTVTADIEETQSIPIRRTSEAAAADYLPESAPPSLVPTRRRLPPRDEETELLTSASGDQGRLETGPRQPAVRAAEPTGEPAIQVSIGTVEVRAVQPPEPSPRPQPAGPKLTLSDYLKQRNEARK